MEYWHREDLANEKLLKCFKESKKICWEWQGYKDKLGYGKVGMNGKYYLAHRLSYMLFKGDIPKGMIIMHICDNPSCVNPAHLQLGTIQDNNKDCMNKGRLNISGLALGRGGRPHSFTKKEIEQIKELVDIRTRKELSIMFNVSLATIDKIRLNRYFK